MEGTTSVVALGDIMSGSPRTFVDFNTSSKRAHGHNEATLGSRCSSPPNYSQAKAMILMSVPVSYGESLFLGHNVPNWILKLIKSK